eukprot:SAG31_NODE_8378_length_1463_cov_1.504399_1_plen_364_part_00
MLLSLSLLPWAPAGAGPAASPPPGMTFMSMMSAPEYGDRNASVLRLQAGWVTHLEVVSGDCNHGRPPSDQHHPDPCPVDTALMELIQHWEPGNQARQQLTARGHAAAPSFMYAELPDCGGCGKGVWKRVEWCPNGPGGPHWCHPQGLDPHWHANLLAITAALKPLVDSGKVGAVALGDELVSFGVSLQNVTTVANMLRQQLGPAVKLVLNDACGALGPASWPTIPAALDYIGCDVYNVTSGRGEAEQIIAYYLQYLAKLRSHQQLLLVPGTFACSTGIGVTQNATSQAAMVLQKLEALEEWAKHTPQVGGFYPWHLMDRMDMPDSERCDFRLGAVSMPTVMAKLSEIGHTIVSRAAQQPTSTE